MTDATPTQNPIQYYTWQGYQCAYEFCPPQNWDTSASPLLLIHPIGVGLSRRFWYRFCREWRHRGCENAIYNPDLIGCGESEKPPVAYQVEDWAEQLQEFIKTVIKQPVILVVQGALLPVAIALGKKYPDSVRAMVLSGPPAWLLMTQPTSPTRQRLLWNLFFDTPAGRLLWSYARQETFLTSFSVRQLFAESKDVDREWLNLLAAGSREPNSRHAVFSFLAGFWRKNYAPDMASLPQPTLAIIGDRASSISREAQSSTRDERCQAYEAGWKNARAIVIPGRNVLPYESTDSFVGATREFVDGL